MSSKLTNPNKEIFIDGKPSGGKLESLQKLYPLTEADFLRLKSEDSKLKTIAGYLIGGVVGYLFSIGKNIFDYIAKKNIEAISFSDCIIVGGGLFLALILYLIGGKTSNEKSKIMNRIKIFFRD